MPRSPSSSSRQAVASGSTRPSPERPACASVAQCTPAYPARVNEILMRAVVEAAAFLELAGDDVVDPDIAVKELESMAYLLGQLNESEKRELVAFTEAEAGRTVSADYWEFLRQFPE